MRTVEAIYQELQAAFAERAGISLNDGCDLAVRLYAAAAQIQALEIQTEWVLAQSFPQTAEGEQLDLHGAMRGVQRLPAMKSRGCLRFSVNSAVSSDLEIPEGSVCMTAAGVRFETTEAASLPAGELSVEVPARAAEAGYAGNVAAGAVYLMSPYPVGITGCTNPEAFSGGTDEESDEAFRVRILESFRRLPNGANAAYYESTALEQEGVAAAKAVGRARGIGTVDVYITGNAGIPEAELLTAVQEQLQAKREIAVDVRTLAPDTQTVNVCAEICVKSGFDFLTVSAAVETAIRGFFRGTLLGKPVSRAALGDLIYHVEGVENYHLLTPDADVTGGTAALPVLGTVQIREMEE